MNSKDLTNFASYLIDLDTQDKEYDLSIFEFLKYQDFENVSPKNCLELSWFASRFIDYEENISNMTDSFIHTFSVINWFHRNSWDVDKYIESCIEYLIKQTYTKKYNEQFIMTRIAHECVVIDVINKEWYGEPDNSELPSEVNAYFFGTKF